MGRSEKCAQEFAPQSHIHSGLNQQDLVSSDVSLAHSDQYAGGGLGPPVKGVNLVFLWVISIVCLLGWVFVCLFFGLFVCLFFFFVSRLISASVSEGS